MDKTSIAEFGRTRQAMRMGLQSVDPDLAAAIAGQRVVIPSGMVLDGSTDQLKPAPAAAALDDPDGDGVGNEIPVSIVDFMVVINRDRRVADVETVYDAERGIFNHLFATAIPLFNQANDGSGHPTIKQPRLGRFVVRNIFTDFKRHDLGPNFHERNFE